MNPRQQTVIITGGATGIGFALAEKFHSAGNRIILVGRSEDALLRATQALPGAEACSADISIAEDRERLIARYPDVTILINNAGIQINKAITDSSAAEIERELNVNSLAPVLLSRAFLSLLLQRPSAAIVNISSDLALVPKELAAMYCASKAALHSFSKTLRWQLDGTGVRVFDVLPLSSKPP